MAHPDTPTKRGTNRLTPRQIDTWLTRLAAGKLREGDPASKLSDGEGMYLTLTRAGTPVWRLKYRHAGTEGTYSIGPYPAISLSTARLERDKARARLREGQDPVQAREVEKAAAMAASDDTFRAVANVWLEKQRKDWSAVHLEKSQRAIERDVFPALGNLPISAIRPAMVSAVIESVVSRGAVDTARKLRQHVGGVFRLAQAKGLCDYKENPADPAREMLPRKLLQKRRPALLKWSELGAVLRAAQAAPLTPVVRAAHRLLAFTGVRISNVVQAEWKEFDLDADAPQWVIPRRKMKAQDRAHDHRVILGPTIANELREWRSVTSGKGYVFPSPAGSPHISRESLEKAYRVTLTLEDRHTPHGWRSALSTLAREEGGFNREVVELALDHIHDNDVARAYDRGERLTERVKLMRWWDAELVKAQKGGEVLPLRKSG